MPPRSSVARSRPAGSRPPPGGEISRAVPYVGMARVSNSAGIGRAVATLASRQHGLVTSTQLRRAGLTKDALHRWLRDGRIHRVARGVYVLGQPHLGERGRIHAAVLACGPSAVVSHRSAAFLLGFGGRSPAVIDAIVADRRGSKIDGVRAHDVPYPAPHERVLLDGIPCTSAARTIVDLAGAYGEEDLNETFERAATAEVLDLGAIDAVLDAGPRRRGAPCLRRVIEWWRPVAETANFEDARSLFEVKLLPLLAAAKLPMPRVNAPVQTLERILEVDLLWGRERFVVEADSRRHHTNQAAFARDRRRDRELMDVGHETLRVTWHEAEGEPEAVLATVRTQLARRQDAA
jgi:very-short-patch-repair endonuclease